MRLIFALFYISFGMWGYFALGGGDFHPLIGFVVAFGLLFSSTVVCNEGFFRFLKRQSDKDYINELLKSGKAKKEFYTVIEAITFEDLAASSLCHFLDIGFNKVLCLHGQYLYDYVEIDDDPELNQKRIFPTRDLELVRKLKNNSVLELSIGKDIINEIRVEYADSIIKELSDLGIKLEDGELIDYVKFSKIKSICTSDLNLRN